MLNDDGKRPMHEGSTAQRRDDIRRLVREALVHWRCTKWEDEYSHCPWGPEGLLPDTVLTAFVSHGLWRDISDVKSSKSTVANRWMWLEDHGQEVLDLANNVDMHARAERAAKRQKLEAERAAARAQVREEDVRKKEAERAQRQEVAEAKRKLKLEEAEKKKEASTARKLAAAMRAEEVSKKRAEKTEKRAAKAAKAEEIARRKAAREKAAQELADLQNIQVFIAHFHLNGDLTLFPSPLSLPLPPPDAFDHGQSLHVPRTIPSCRPVYGLYPASNRCRQLYLSILSHLHLLSYQCLAFNRNHWHCPRLSCVGHHRRLVLVSRYYRRLLPHP